MAGSKYRTFDGSCNNLDAGRTAWGAADRALARVVAQPAYADGTYTGDSLRCLLLSYQPAARVMEDSCCLHPLTDFQAKNIMLAQSPAPIHVHVNLRNTAHHIVTIDVIHALLEMYDAILTNYLLTSVIHAAIITCMGLNNVSVRFSTTPGLHAPRVSEFASKPLPTARDVSIAISAASGITEFNTTRRLSEVDSLLLMQVGQFLDHDYALSPIPGKRLLTSQLYISGGADISNFAPVYQRTV